MLANWAICLIWCPPMFSKLSKTGIEELLLTVALVELLLTVIIYIGLFLRNIYIWTKGSEKNPMRF